MSHVPRLVSVWNAGGDGELSEPVQESTPQGNLVI